jgi:capsular polysaccharide biosynthesis protein cpsI
MNNELISIIVPVYKVEKYLEKCVKSILNQTYTNLEIILVNDGSPDECGRLCDELAKVDNRIKVFHKENGGLSDARNYGVERASGEYIGFVDSDDYIHESMYEKLYEAIKKSGTELSECGVTRVYKDMLRPHYEGEDYFLILDKQEYLGEYLENRRLYGSAWCKLIQRDLAKKIKFPTGKIYEDAFYTLELLENVNKFTIISGNYYYYYIRENSITTRPFSSNDMDYIEIMDRIRDYTLSNFPKFKEQLLVRLTYAYLSIFNQLIVLDNYKTKKEYKVLKDKLKDSYFKVLANKKAPKNLKLALVLLSINERLYKFILSKYKKYESNE